MGWPCAGLAASLAGGVLGLMLVVLGLSGTALSGRMPGSASRCGRACRSPGRPALARAVEARATRPKLAASPLQAKLWPASAAYAGKRRLYRPAGQIVDAWPTSGDGPSCGFSTSTITCWPVRRERSSLDWPVWPGFSSDFRAILWWRTRRPLPSGLAPAFQPSAIVRQHRDLGIVLAPFLRCRC